MAKTDDQLATDFVAKLKFSPDMLKTSRTIFVGSLSNYLTQRRLGNKAEAKKWHDHFIGEIKEQAPGIEKSVLTKIAGAIDSWGKQNARFTYTAAFKKRAGDIKKLMTISKSKGGAEAMRASEKLHKAMIDNNELPNNVFHKDFNAELLKNFKGKIDFSEGGAAEKAPSKSQMEKQIKAIKWGPVINKYKLGKSPQMQKELTSLAIGINEKGPKDAVMRSVATALLQQAKNKKDKPQALVNAVYDEVTDLFV